MNLNFLRVGVAAVLVALSVGCFTDQSGHRKVGPPSAITSDRIVSRYERPVDQIFAASKEVLRFNGTLYGENTISHTLEAKVDTRTVWVSVTEVEPKITEVVVQARKKSRMADKDLAAEIDKQIALRLR